MSKKNTPPGSVFLVPLRDTGYGIGVMARNTGNGDCLGYFFGPRVDDAAKASLDGIQPDCAVLVGFFGDLDLIRGTWIVIGEMNSWKAENWPVPEMVRIVDGKAILSAYDDNLQFVGEREISLSESSLYPRDRMMGSGAVEIRLTKLIGDEAATA